MHESWVSMLIVWLVVECIQFLRKKPFPQRMTAGAWFGVIVMTLILVGQAPNEQNTLVVLAISLTISLGGVGIVYGIRLIIAKLWTNFFGKRDIATGSLTRRLHDRPNIENGSPSSVRFETETAPVAMPLRVSPTIPTANISQMSSPSPEKQVTATTAHASITPTRSVNESHFLTSMPLDKSNEEDSWATAMQEVETGQRRPGIWAKAFAECDGDETKTKVAYLKARVQQLTEVAQAIEAQREAQRQDEFAKEKAASLAKQQAIEQAGAQFVSTGTISLDQLRLLVHQADKASAIELRDSVKGNMLLHICAESEMVEEVNALLLAGADPQLSNNKGLRPEFMTTNQLVRQLLHGLKVTVEQLNDLLRPPQGKCPNSSCSAVIPMSSQECPKCGAFFRVGSAWCVLPLGENQIA